MKDSETAPEIVEISSVGDIQQSEQWPTITVQVCTCNLPDRERLLARCLSSVLEQTYDDFDVVVVCDGPPRVEIIKVCETYEHYFAKRGIDFYFVWVDEPTGYYTIPRNHALQYCAGDYIAHLDDDNEWFPHTLETYLKAIEEGEKWPDFVYGRREYVKDDGAPDEVGGEKLVVGESPFVEFNEEALMRLAISWKYNFVDSSEFMISKGALYMMLAIQGKIWDESKRRFGDWNLITRGVWPDFGVGWRGKGIDKVVQRYHWHASNVQHTRPAFELPRAEKINE